jgi:hypothetical protein
MAAVESKNKMGQGTAGPGIKWNPNSVGDYKRGLKAPKTGSVEGHMRKGAGAKQ